MLAGYCVSDDAGLEALHDEWDALAVRCGRPGSSPDLLLAWWRHLRPPGAAARVVAVRDGDGALVGVAPLLVADGPMRLPFMRFLGTPSMPQRAGIVARAEDEGPVAAAVAEALGNSSPRPAAVSLDRIDADRAWPGILAGAWPGRHGAHIFREFRVPVPTLSTASGDVERWRATRSSNTRHAATATRRRLAARGAEVRRLEHPDELGPALAAFARLQAQRWGPRSQLWLPPSIAMLREAGVAMLGAGRMRVYAVTDGAEVGAVAILFAAGGEVLAWNGAWDPGWARERPFMAALDRAIEDCFAEGDRRLDFGEGDQPFKLRLADGEDAISWTTMLARGRGHRRAWAATARTRWTLGLRARARRLPPPAQQAIRTVLNRARTARATPG
ncbi:MAG: GNAT family N-acetyltransferase [Thermoleophilia bacterium]